jgi:hypothetical protein
MDPNGDTSNGKNRLFNDSKLGLIVAGLGTVAIDAVLDGIITQVSSIDLTGTNSWWTTVASAGVATLLGLVTAYKAKRSKTRQT